MNKKNKLMNAVSIVVSGIITFFIAHSRYVNRMPMAIDINDTYKKSILEEAKKQVGFVVNDSKLLVEAYATQDGFFIITFTKFDNKFFSVRIWG